MGELANHPSSQNPNKIIKERKNKKKDTDEAGKLKKEDEREKRLNKS